MIFQALVLILTITFSFLQATILPLNLVFLLVIVVSLLGQEFSFPFAFLAGLVLDLVRGENLGISPVIFLLTAGVVFLIKKALFFRESSRRLTLPTIKFR